MAEEDEAWRELLGGDESRAASLFAEHRPALRRMVDVRLDPRVRGRVDPSDVVQETYLEMCRRLRTGTVDRRSTPRVWLRLLTTKCLQELHRSHLGAGMRDVRLEARKGALAADATSLVARLASSFSSPSVKVGKAEMHARAVAVLESLEPADREILVLRHLEDLSNQEVCEVLGLKKAAASNRYVRALSRLRETLGDELG